MTSAIRFSRSQSQNSQATGASVTSSVRVAAAGSGRTSQTSQPRRETLVDAAEISEVFQEIPSSIPSAPSHPASRHSKRTNTSATTTDATTSGHSKSNSACRSQSRHSISQPASDAADAAAYPWGFYYPPLFPSGTAPSTTAAASGKAFTAFENGHKENVNRKRQCAQPSFPPHRFPQRQYAKEAFPFAVPNIPWIPPPPIHGALQSEPRNTNEYIAQYYAGLAAAEQQQQLDGQTKDKESNRRKATQPPELTSPFMPSNTRQSTSYNDWPTPEQLPLPSTFPMPPYALPYQHGRSGIDLFPPPPLPPWWFLQALDVPPRPSSQASLRSSSSSSYFSSESHSECEDDRSSSSSSSRTTSPSPHRGDDVPYASPRRQKRQDEQKRFTAPVGSVETPTPMTRKNANAVPATAANVTTTTHASDNSTNRTATGSKVVGVPPARPVNRRALPSSGSSISADAAHRSMYDQQGGENVDSLHQHSLCSIPTVGKSREASRARREDEEEECDRRMQRVLATAESYLARIEDLYQRLRHRYEEVLLSPVRGVDQLADRATPQCFSTTTEHPPQGEDMKDDSKDGNSREKTQPQHLSTQQRSQPTSHRYAAAPTRAPSQTPPPTFKHENTARSAFRPSMSPSTTSAASQSLRDELAVLESQWQRLEELKQHSLGAGAAFASSDSRFHTLPSSPTFSANTAESPTGFFNTAAHPTRGGDVFSNQSVMELINERKHLLASAT